MQVHSLIEVKHPGAESTFLKKNHVLAEPGACMLPLCRGLVSIVLESPLHIQQRAPTTSSHLERKGRGTTWVKIFLSPNSRLSLFDSSRRERKLWSLRLRRIESLLCRSCVDAGLGMKHRAYRHCFLTIVFCQSGHAKLVTESMRIQQFHTVAECVGVALVHIQVHGSC